MNHVFTLIILAAVLVSGATQAAGDCAGGLGPQWSKDQAEVAEIRKAWLPLYRANPENHNPRKFRYIIRARGFTVNSGKLSDDVSHIASQVNISGSVVDQNYVRTFGAYNYGLILKVPPENLLGSSAYDMGGGQTTNSAQVFRNFGLDTPDSLMKKSHAMMNEVKASDPDHGSGLSFFNEVRFEGTVGKTKVIPAGLFYLNTMPPGEVRRLKSVGRAMGLPVVKLEEIPQS
jgi:hypothetical protein